MYFGDCVLPLLNGTEMMVEKGKVEGAVAVGLPWLVDVWATGNVERLQAHASVDTFERSRTLTQKTDLDPHAL